MYVTVPNGILMFIRFQDLKQRDEFEPELVLPSLYLRLARKTPTGAAFARPAPQWRLP